MTVELKVEDKKADTVLARKDVDKTRKQEFKKKIADMKLRTKDSPNRTRTTTDKKNPLTQPPPVKTPDKNKNNLTDKIADHVTPVLTRKRKFKENILDKN